MWHGKWLLQCHTAIETFLTANLQHPEGVSLQLLVRCSNSATILSRSCAEFLDRFLDCFVIIAARTSDPSVSLTGVRAVQISCRFRHRKNSKSPFPTDTHSKCCPRGYCRRLHPNTGKQRLGGTCSPESHNQI